MLIIGIVVQHNGQMTLERECSLQMMTSQEQQNGTDIDSCQEDMMIKVAI
jgi:hypothetical protein